VELLKQGQYVPMPIEEQVVVVYAGTQGYLDKVGIPDVRRYEKELLDFMRLRYKDLLKNIAEKKELNQEITATLKTALQDFTEKFK